MAIRGLAGAETEIGEGLVVRPLVVIDYVWVYQDSFTEKNAGVGNLSLKSDGAQALRIYGGLVYSRPFAFEIRGRKARLVPEIRGGLVGQLVLGSRNVAASLPGLGGAFTLRGNESSPTRCAGRWVRASACGSRSAWRSSWTTPASTAPTRVTAASSAGCVSPFEPHPDDTNIVA